MPVERKELMSFLLQEECRPCTFETLQEELNIKGEKEIAELYRLLSVLEEEGFICKTPQGRYAPLRGNNMLVGTLQGHNRGYAFLLPEAPGEADVFIPPDKTGGALHRDRVIVRLLSAKKDGRREGEVTRILKRENKYLVGTYEGSRRSGIVVPDDRRIPHKIQVGAIKDQKVRSGDKVLLEVSRWPSPNNPELEGKITEVIGPAGAPGVDITSIQKRFGLPDAFPEKTLQELEKYKEEDIEKVAATEDRLDLRDLELVTIDGADAKDLDDAVSLERTADGDYRLGVHIADVSWYVQEGSALDREALKRGTSAYLVDRVIPMLPPGLSNDLCSLNPGVPRLAVSVFIDLDEKGKILRYKYAPSLICVRERMTYDDVNLILDGDPQARRRYERFTGVFEDMHKLAATLKERRKAQGALDFNFPEAKITLDDQGKPLKIEAQHGGPAESMIEEFMLLCNGVIATHFRRLKTPFIYRIHEQPEVDKLFALRDFLTLFNIKLKGDLSEIKPKQFQQILHQVEGTAVEKIVSYVLLRSLPQARYSDAPLGHFGLATGDYTHFTSPIRRYPDLIVHRLLRKLLPGKLPATEKRRLTKLLPKVAASSSEAERTAVEAERATQELKKLEYMQGKEGEEYDGLISGVTSFGFFVELPDTVEGLVHVSMLQGDYFIFDQKRYTLTGERSGTVYRLGDPVRVRLVRVDWEMRSIHFLPVEAADNGAGEPPQKKMRRENKKKKDEKEKTTRRRRQRR